MKLKTYFRLSVTWIFFGMVNASIPDAPTGSSLGISPNLRDEYVREPAQNAFDVCLYRNMIYNTKLVFVYRKKGKNFRKRELSHAINLKKCIKVQIQTVMVSSLLPLISGGFFRLTKFWKRGGTPF